MLQKEEFYPIGTLRHEMHISNDYSDWWKLRDDLLEYVFKNDLPKIKLPNVRDTDSFDCGRNDCGYENGDCECEYCDILAKEYLGEAKNETNDIIEQYLLDIEDNFEFEENSIAPTGIARANWMSNNCRGLI